MFLGRRLSLRKNVVTRPPEQATVLPEAPKALSLPIILGARDCVLSVPVAELCPHPLPQRASRMVSGPPLLPGLMHGLLWFVPCASPLPTPPFHPVDY